MAVAHDAVTESSTWTTTPDPFTFTHTPSGTPAGVLLFIASDGSSDQIDGTVSYGGVAMTRVGYVTDVATETGASWMYFLGAGIPSGAQTVSIAHTASADTKWAVCATVTASTDTEIGSAVTVSQDFSPTTDPVLNKGLGSGLAYFGLYFGSPLSGLTGLVSGMTDLNTEEDFASNCFRFDRETSASSGDVQIGYTRAGDDDLAFLGVNIVEVGSGGYVLGAAQKVTTGGTTTFVLLAAGDLADTDMYFWVTSRDSTSASADVTCTDDSGVGSWASIGGDADKKAWVFWKRGSQADVGATITIAAAVGSTSGGMVWLRGTAGAGGDPTTNLTLETNASGDESHASIDPTNDNSPVLFSIHDYANDTNVPTAVSGATSGAFTSEFQSASTGGSDCRTSVFTDFLASGATGTVTWSQTNATTKSVLFAVAPVAGDATGTGASTLDDVTSAGSGVVANPVTGTGSSTLGGVTSAGTGAETFTATGASTLAGVTSAGTGAVANPITGTGASTLDGVTSTGTGTVIQPVTGSGASTLDGVTSAGAGTLGFVGVGASTLGDVMSSGAGVVANPITGTGSSVLDGVTSQGTGEALVPGHIENVVCDLLGPLGECEDLGPSGDCDSYGPLCVGTMTS